VDHLDTTEDSSLLAKIRINNFIFSINLSPAPAKFGLRNFGHKIPEFSNESKVVNRCRKVYYSELL
jgi:hypothetical protein